MQKEKLNIITIRRGSLAIGRHKARLKFIFVRNF